MSLFVIFLSHYILLSPLVPSSGNSLNQSLNPGSKIEINFNKVIVTRCENRGQPIEATRQIMTGMLREVSSLTDNLAMSRIPHYLVEGVRWRVWLPLLSPVLFVLLSTTTADAFV